MTSETISRLTCLRCDYRWFPRKEGLPVRCPHCKSPYWNRARMTVPASETRDELLAGIRYYDEHRDEIEKEYGGEYVAVTGDGVIDHGPDFSSLAERLFEHGSWSLLVRKAGPDRPIRIGPRPRLLRT